MSEDIPRVQRFIDELEQKEERLEAAARQMQGALADHKRLAGPLLNELAAAGFQVDTISDLPRQYPDYSLAVPTLLKWLPLMTDARVKDAIVATLGLRRMRSAIAPVLLEQFRMLSQEPYHFAKWQIGATVERIADDTMFDQIALILKDTTHADSREMLAVSLGKMKRRAPDAIRLLDNLLSEGDLPGHAMAAIRRLSGTAARANVERYLTSKNSWLRSEAKKTIAKFDKPQTRTRATKGSMGASD
jgi:hypothetical protein